MRLWPKRKERSTEEPLETETMEGTSACPKCVNPLPARARTCPYCGERFKDFEPTVDETEPPRSLKRSALLFLRDIVVAVLIVLIVLGAVYAYTRVWPPMVVIESNSMQHENGVSYVGVIDTGDLVLVQAAPQRADVITWAEGRATGYRTYSNYGDVIIFKRPGSDTPIIHRPILWLDYNPATLKFDIAALEDPALAGLWGGTYANGTVVINPRNLDGMIWIKTSGWKNDLNITFRIGASFIGSNLSSPRYQRSGYVTLGDNNAYRMGSYDDYLVRQEDILGKARGELPWFGLIKLTLSPSNGACCPRGWGDTYAPKNSWDSLLISLILIILAPIIVDVSFALWHRRRIKKAESKLEEPKEGQMAEERHVIPQTSKNRSEDAPSATPSGPSSEEKEPDNPSI